MGLGDKFKTMAKQAQDAVAEHKDKLQETVGTVGVAVNEKTQGKYASHISKIGDKANQTIEKVGSSAQDQAGTERMQTRQVRRLPMPRRPRRRSQRTSPTRRPRRPQALPTHRPRALRTHRPRASRTRP